MALTKLVCPECSKVLRPAKPVAAGKKVRCPKCEFVFVAGEDEDEDEDGAEEEEERPKKKKPVAAKKEAPAKKAAPTKKAAADEEEGEGAYSLTRDDEDEDKPKVNYAPDSSIKDLRGPAVLKLMPPTNKLTFSGFVGVAGALILVLLLAIPALLPVTADPPKEDAQQAAKDKKPASKVIWYKVYGINFAWVTERPLNFVLVLPIFIVLGLYSALVANGGIKAQNLESRRWGIVGSIMAMLPLNTFCAQMALGLLIRCAFLMVLDDDDFIDWTYIGFGVIIYLLSVLSGVWTLVTLQDEEVIAGFEYEGE